MKSLLLLAVSLTLLELSFPKRTTTKLKRLSRKNSHGHSSRRSRQDSKDKPVTPDPVLQMLEEQARLIPLSQYEDDPYLLQKIDRVNSISAYSTPYKLEGKDNDVVYERTQNDKDKEVVVLSRDEDKVNLKAHSSKQTYVVLRKNPKSIAPAYYASYAYLRNATYADTDTDTVDILGQKITIEWDIWEDRNIKKPVLWTSCASTVLLSCGFNATEFGSSFSPASALILNMSGQSHQNKELTKPSVLKDDTEYTMDNYDFFDDLNIDLVRGRAMKQPGLGSSNRTQQYLLSSFPTEVGELDLQAKKNTKRDTAGDAGKMVCGVVGSIFGGQCGGRMRKTIFMMNPLKALPALGVPPRPGVGYALISPDGPPPLPPIFNPLISQGTSGVFYPDDKVVPPAMGNLIIEGLRKPYLFKVTKKLGSGMSSPAKGTLGSFVPNIPGGVQQILHGILLPSTSGIGVFMPDKLAYRCSVQPALAGRWQAPIHGFCQPGYPGYPDSFIPDSDLTNPMRRYPPQTPLNVVVNPDPPNPLRVGQRQGILLSSKVPPAFFPLTLGYVRATFSDEKRQVRPIAGFLIPGYPGEPDPFFPDDESILQVFKNPIIGMMAPNPPTSPAHGTLVPPTNIGDAAHWVSDSKGGHVRFDSTDASIYHSEGTLMPIDPKVSMEYFPTQRAPRYPALIPGTMTPMTPRAQGPITGHLIINKAVPPFEFVADGVATTGTLYPGDKKPPVNGVWVPGFPGTPDEFVAFDEPPGGVSPTKGEFSLAVNIETKIQIVIGHPTHPGGPATIQNTTRPPPDKAAISVLKWSLGLGKSADAFIPDPDHLGKLKLNPKWKPAAGSDDIFIPDPDNPGKIIPNPNWWRGSGGNADAFIPDPDNPGKLKPNTNWKPGIAGTEDEFVPDPEHPGKMKANSMWAAGSAGIADEFIPDPEHPGKMRVNPKWAAGSAGASDIFIPDPEHPGKLKPNPKWTSPAAGANDIFIPDPQTLPDVETPTKLTPNPKWWTVQPGSASPDLFIPDPESPGKMKPNPKWSAGTFGTDDIFIPDPDDPVKLIPNKKWSSSAAGSDDIFITDPDRLGDLMPNPKWWQQYPGSADIFVPDPEHPGKLKPNSKWSSLSVGADDIFTPDPEIPGKLTPNPKWWQSDGGSADAFIPDPDHPGKIKPNPKWSAGIAGSEDAFNPDPDNPGKAKPNPKWKGGLVGSIDSFIPDPDNPTEVQPNPNWTQEMAGSADAFIPDPDNPTKVKPNPKWAGGFVGTADAFIADPENPGKVKPRNKWSTDGSADAFIPDPDNPGKVKLKPGWVGGVTGSQDDFIPDPDNIEKVIPKHKPQYAATMAGDPDAFIPDPEHPGKVKLKPGWDAAGNPDDFIPDPDDVENVIPKPKPAWAYGAAGDPDAFIPDPEDKEKVIPRPDWQGPPGDPDKFIYDPITNKVIEKPPPPETFQKSRTPNEPKTPTILSQEEQETTPLPPPFVSPSDQHGMLVPNTNLSQMEKIVKKQFPPEPSPFVPGDTPGVFKTSPVLSDDDMKKIVKAQLAQQTLPDEPPVFVHEPGDPPGELKVNKLLSQDDMQKVLKQQLAPPPSPPLFVPDQQTGKLKVSNVLSQEDMQKEVTQQLTPEVPAPPVEVLFVPNIEKPWEFKVNNELPQAEMQKVLKQQLKGEVGTNSGLSVPDAETGKVKINNELKQPVMTDLVKKQLITEMTEPLVPDPKNQTVLIPNPLITPNTSLFIPDTEMPGELKPNPNLTPELMAKLKKIKLKPDEVEPFIPDPQKLGHIIPNPKISPDTAAFVPDPQTPGRLMANPKLTQEKMKVKTKLQQEAEAEPFIPDPVKPGSVIPNPKLTETSAFVPDPEKPGQLKPNIKLSQEAMAKLAKSHLTQEHEPEPFVPDPRKPGEVMPNPTVSHETSPFIPDPEKPGLLKPNTKLRQGDMKRIAYGHAASAGEPDSQPFIPDPEKPGDVKPNPRLTQDHMKKIVKAHFKEQAHEPFIPNPEKPTETIPNPKISPETTAFLPDPEKPGQLKPNLKLSQEHMKKIVRKQLAKQADIASEPFVPDVDTPGQVKPNPKISLKTSPFIPDPEKPGVLKPNSGLTQKEMRKMAKIHLKDQASEPFIPNPVLPTETIPNPRISPETTAFIPDPEKPGELKLNTKLGQEAMKKVVRTQLAEQVGPGAEPFIPDLQKPGQVVLNPIISLETAAFVPDPDKPGQLKPNAALGQEVMRKVVKAQLKQEIAAHTSTKKGGLGEDEGEWKMPEMTKFPDIELMMKKQEQLIPDPQKPGQVILNPKLPEEKPAFVPDPQKPGQVKLNPNLGQEEMKKVAKAQLTEQFGHGPGSEPFVADPQKPGQVIPNPLISLDTSAFIPDHANPGQLKPNTKLGQEDMRKVMKTQLKQETGGTGDHDDDWKMPTFKMSDMTPFPDMKMNMHEPLLSDLKNPGQQNLNPKLAPESAAYLLDSEKPGQVKINPKLSQDDMKKVVKAQLAEQVGPGAASEPFIPDPKNPGQVILNPKLSPETTAFIPDPERPGQLKPNRRLGQEDMKKVLRTQLKQYQTEANEPLVPDPQIPGQFILNPKLSPDTTAFIPDPDNPGQVKRNPKLGQEEMKKIVRKQLQDEVGPGPGSEPFIPHPQKPGQVIPNPIISPETAAFVPDPDKPGQLKPNPKLGQEHMKKIIRKQLQQEIAAAYTFEPFVPDPEKPGQVMANPNLKPDTAPFIPDPDNPGQLKPNPNLGQEQMKKIVKKQLKEDADKESLPEPYIPEPNQPGHVIPNPKFPDSSPFIPDPEKPGQLKPNPKLDQEDMKKVVKHQLKDDAVVNSQPFIPDPNKLGEVIPNPKLTTDDSPFIPDPDNPGQLKPNPKFPQEGMKKIVKKQLKHDEHAASSYEPFIPDSENPDKQIPNPKLKSVKSDKLPFGPDPDNPGKLMPNPNLTQDKMASSPETAPFIRDPEKPGQLKPNPKLGQEGMSKVVRQQLKELSNEPFIPNLEKPTESIPKMSPEVMAFIPDPQKPGQLKPNTKIKTTRAFVPASKQVPFTIGDNPAEGVSGLFTPATPTSPATFKADEGGFKKLSKVLQDTKAEGVDGNVLGQRVSLIPNKDDKYSYTISKSLAPATTPAENRLQPCILTTERGGSAIKGSFASSKDASGAEVGQFVPENPSDWNKLPPGDISGTITWPPGINAGGSMDESDLENPSFKMPDLTPFPDLKIAFSVDKFEKSSSPYLSINAKVTEKIDNSAKNMVRTPQQAPFSIGENPEKGISGLFIPASATSPATFKVDDEATKTLWENELETSTQTVYGYVLGMRGNLVESKENKNIWIFSQAANASTTGNQMRQATLILDGNPGVIKGSYVISKPASGNAPAKEEGFFVPQLPLDMKSLEFGVHSGTVSFQHEGVATALPDLRIKFPLDKNTDFSHYLSVKSTITEKVQSAADKERQMAMAPKQAAFAIGDKGEDGVSGIFIPAGPTNPAVFKVDDEALKKLTKVQEDKKSEGVDGNLLGQQVLIVPAKEDKHLYQITKSKTATSGTESYRHLQQCILTLDGSAVGINGCFVLFKDSSGAEIGQFVPQNPSDLSQLAPGDVSGTITWPPGTNAGATVDESWLNIPTFKMPDLTPFPDMRITFPVDKSVASSPYVSIKAKVMNKIDNSAKNMVHMPQQAPFLIGDNPEQGVFGMFTPVSANSPATFKVYDEGLSTLLKKQDEKKSQGVEGFVLGMHGNLVQSKDNKNLWTFSQTHSTTGYQMKAATLIPDGSPTMIKGSYIISKEKDASGNEAGFFVPQFPSDMKALGFGDKSGTVSFVTQGADDSAWKMPSFKIPAVTPLPDLRIKFPLDKNMAFSPCMSFKSTIIEKVQSAAERNAMTTPKQAPFSIGENPEHGVSGLLTPASATYPATFKVDDAGLEKLTKAQEENKSEGVDGYILGQRGSMVPGKEDKHLYTFSKTKTVQSAASAAKNRMQQCVLIPDGSAVGIKGSFVTSKEQDSNGNDFGQFVPETPSDLGQLAPGDISGTISWPPGASAAFGIDESDFRMPSFKMPDMTPFLNLRITFPLDKATASSPYTSIKAKITEKVTNGAENMVKTAQQAPFSIGENPEQGVSGLFTPASAASPATFKVDDEGLNTLLKNQQEKRSTGVEGFVLGMRGILVQTKATKNLWTFSQTTTITTSGNRMEQCAFIADGSSAVTRGSYVMSKDKDQNGDEIGFFVPQISSDLKQLILPSGDVEGTLKWPGMGDFGVPSFNMPNLSPFPNLKIKFPLDKNTPFPPYMSVKTTVKEKLGISMGKSAVLTAQQAPFSIEENPDNGVSGLFTPAGPTSPATFNVHEEALSILLKSQTDKKTQFVDGYILGMRGNLVQTKETKYLWTLVQTGMSKATAKMEQCSLASDDSSTTISGSFVISKESGTEVGIFVPQSPSDLGQLGSGSMNGSIIWQGSRSAEPPVGISFEVEKSKLSLRYWSLRTTITRKMTTTTTTVTTWKTINLRESTKVSFYPMSKPGTRIQGSITPPEPPKNADADAVGTMNVNTNDFSKLSAKMEGYMIVEHHPEIQPFNVAVTPSGSPVVNSKVNLISSYSANAQAQGQAEGQAEKLQKAVEDGLAPAITSSEAKQQGSGWGSLSGMGGMFGGMPGLGSASGMLGEMSAMGSNMMGGASGMFSGMSGSASGMSGMGSNMMGGLGNMGGMMPSMSGMSGMMHSMSRMSGMMPSMGGMSGIMPSMSGMSGMMPSMSGMSGMMPSMSGMSGMMPSMSGMSGVMPSMSGMSGVMPSMSGISGMMHSMSGISGIMPSMSGMSGMMPNMGSLSGLTGGLGSLGGLTSGIRGMTGSLPGLGSLSDGAYKITGMIPRVGSLSSVTEMVPGVGSLSDGASKITGMMPGVGSLSSVTGMMPSLGSASELLGGVTGGASNLLAGMTGSGSQLLAGLKGGGSNLLGSLKGSTSGLLGGLGGGTSNLFGGLAGGVSNLLGNLGGGTSGLLGGTSQLFGGLTRGAKKARRGDTAPQSYVWFSFGQNLEHMVSGTFTPGSPATFQVDEEYLNSLSPTVTGFLLGMRGTLTQNKGDRLWTFREIKPTREWTHETRYLIEKSNAVLSAAWGRSLLHTNLTQEEEANYKSLMEKGPPSTDLYKPSNYEVGLVPLGQEPPPADMMKQTCPVGIRGMYFKNNIGQQTFVHFSGTMGSFVINGVPPNDPKVQKIEGSYVPRQPASPSDIGPPHHDGNLTPDPSRPGTVDASALEQPKQQGVFYPVGATAAGISGYLMKNTANQNEQLFFFDPQPQMGTFKPIAGVGCYMYNELAQLVPYDPEAIKGKQEEAIKTPVPMKAFNFQGAANFPKYDIYVPLDGCKGKFTIANSANTIHGHFLAKTGAQAVFTPDEAVVFQNLIASGKLKGSFEQDETPSVAGIFPGNGITVEVSSQGGKYLMILDKPGRIGQLTPGRKPTPGYFIYCFGLIQNDLSRNQDTPASPVQQGRGFDLPPAPPEPVVSKMGRRFGAVKKPEPEADGKLAEHMDGRSMLSQDFGAYLKQNTTTHTWASYTTTTALEYHSSYSYEISAKQMEVIGQGAVQMMKFTNTSEQKGSFGTSNSTDIFGQDGKVLNETLEEESKSHSNGTQGNLFRTGNNMHQAVGGRFKELEEASASMSASASISEPPPKGMIRGVAYKSNKGSNIFVPTTGTLGELHFQLVTTLLNLQGTFSNSKADGKTSDGSFLAQDRSKLAGVDAPGTIKAIFVPSGGQGDEGGIQVTIPDLKSSQNGRIQFTIDVPGQKSSLAVGAQTKSDVNESYAVTMLSNTGLPAASHGQMKKVPQEAVVSEQEQQIDSSKGIHGTYYRVDSKSTFFADYPGTPGTFYARTGGPSVRGNFFPPVKGSSPADPDVIVEILPWGKELIGKFVPDESSNPGQSMDKGNERIAGSIEATQVPHSYKFKPDLPGQSGYVAVTKVSGSSSSTSFNSASSSGGGGSDINAKDGAFGRALNKDEEPMVDFVPDNQIDIALHPGWKTQYEIIVPNVTLKYDDEIFFGIGNCPHRSLTPANLAKATSDDEVLDFYMGLLRTSCISSQKKYIKSLVKQGYLEIKNKLIVVPANSKYLTVPKLTVKETERLSSAFEMCVFTLTYSDEVKKGITLESVVTPEGKRIARSVRYLVDMSILGMKLARELCRRHSVRLSRNLITTLVTAITKLKQDIEALKGCEDCEMDRDIIHNDSMQLMGMVQFIMHGLGSVDPSAGLRDAYEAFYKAHNELIHRKVLQIQEDY